MSKKIVFKKSLGRKRYTTVYRRYYTPVYYSRSYRRKVPNTFRVKFETSFDVRHAENAYAPGSYLTGMVPIDGLSTSAQTLIVNKGYRRIPFKSIMSAASISGRMSTIGTSFKSFRATGIKITWIPKSDASDCKQIGALAFVKDEAYDEAGKDYATVAGYNYKLLCSQQARVSRYIPLTNFEFFKSYHSIGYYAAQTYSFGSVYFVTSVDSTASDYSGALNGLVEICVYGRFSSSLL